MKLSIPIGYIKDDTENGAASVIRTRDLTLTKGALYRWSYGSTDRSFTLLYKPLQGRLACPFMRFFRFKTQAEKLFLRHLCFWFDIVTTILSTAVKLGVTDTIIHY